MRAVGCAVILSVWFGLLQFVSPLALTYNMTPYEKACFYEVITHPKQKLLFYFAVLSGGNVDIDLTVADPNGRIVHEGKKQKQGDFVFTDTYVGDYAVCFSNGAASFASKAIEFDLTVEHEDGPDAHENQPHEVTPLEESLNSLRNDIFEIMKVLKIVKARHIRNMATVDATESRVFYFALAESVLIVFMAAIQVYVLRNFFSVKGKMRV